MEFQTQIKLICIFVCAFQIMHISGQKVPPFRGRNRVPVRPYLNASRRLPVKSMPGNFPPVSPSNRGSTQLQDGEWSPGEPNRTFPMNRENRINTCQKTGCTGQDSHCVFWGSPCPSSVRGVPCRCQRGCLVDKLFIPYRQSRVVDRCNNVCTCRSRAGRASCTTRRC